jgi:serine/threonine-protein kinase
MAEVWRAHDDRLERDVAIKFLRSHLATEPEFLVRFFAEAQSVARINHPNVVSILDFGSYEEAPYLVMELVEGGALDGIAGAPLPTDRALELVEEASLGAGAAHELGLVHRDIKPANILLGPDGQAKITDFGIASSRGQETLTATGTAIGSPHYISNEQVAGGPPTPRSDVYSLGVVLYELLTGVRPFEGDNVTAIAIAHVDQEPEPPSTHNPDIDPALDALVLRCMSKDASDRFEDGIALAQEIGRVRSGATGPLPVPVPTAIDDEEPVEPLQPIGPVAEDRRTGMFVGVAMVVLLLAAGVAVLLGGGRDEPTAAATVPDPASTSTPKERHSPKADPTVDAAPVVDTESPSPSPEPTEPEKEEAEEDDNDSEGPSGTFSGGTDAEPDEPKEEPTEEPTEDPAEDPTPDATPESDSTPQDSTDGEAGG